MCSVSLSRIFLFILNFIFWIAGAALLGIGIWMKVDPTIVHYFHVVNIGGSDTLTDHASTLFIVVGAFVFIIGFLGCCGALRKSQWMLFLYALLVLIIVIIELVGAILVIIYRTKIEGKLKEDMYSQVHDDYAPKSDTQEAWDYIQVTLKCCGANGTVDYATSKWHNETQGKNGTVPITCCILTNGDYQKPVAKDFDKCQEDAGKAVEDSEYLHTEGCYEATKDWFKTHSLILVIVAFIVAIIQIGGFAAACFLRTMVKREQP